MSLRDSLKISLQTRFSLAILLSISCFVATALFLKVSLMQVRTDVGGLAEEQIQQVVSVSHIVRELGQIVSQLPLVESENRDHAALHQDVQELLEALEGHQGKKGNPQLAELHKRLYLQVTVFTDQHQRVDELRGDIRRGEEALNKSILKVENDVSVRLANLGEQGVKRQAYERFGRVVSDFGRALQDISPLELEPIIPHFTTESSAKLAVSIKVLGRFEARLLDFHFLEPSSDWLGAPLVQSLQNLQEALQRFQGEILKQRDDLVQLQETAGKVLGRLEMFENRLSVSAAQARSAIEMKMSATETVVWVLFSGLALLLGWLQFRLYRQHVRIPMEEVRRCFDSFQQGDYDSPMSLSRDDEWGQVETGFNNMLGDLQKSWNALKESERRYRSIYDNSSVGIYRSTVEGEFLNINAATAVMLGLDGEESLSAYNDLGTMIYAEERDREILIERLLREETVEHYETQLKRKNGERFWATLNCHLLRDQNGQVQFIEGTMEDITRRREAVEQLRKFKEYLHDIVDAMPSILIGVNRDLKISLWNRQAAEMSGVPDAKAFERRLPEVFVLLDEKDYLDQVRQTLADGEVIRLQQLAGIGKFAGRFFDLLIYPLRSVDATEAVLHLEDVTEKAQMAEVMIQSEKMLSVGSLAAGMAHEINNPLASVLQNVQVLGQRLSPSLKKNQLVAEHLGISIEQVADYARLRGFNQMINSIAESGQRAARIIENMLNFSRQSSSNFLPRSLQELTDKTIELARSDYDMKHNFDFRKIDLVREYQTVPEVPCEAGQIQQVVLSLLKNAAQAIPTDAEKPEIRVRIFQQQDTVCLQVEDNGMGMDEVTSRRIFEPFFTTKEVGRGTGLGLSVAYFLITENHKGSLTVTSEPGKGSCFSIRLPLQRPSDKS